MNVTFSKRFSKQLDLLKDKSLLQKVSKLVKSVMQTDSIQNIPNLKKMKGHSSAYRIRLGDYRVGLFVKEDCVLFAILGHRKNIYKNFP